MYEIKWTFDGYTDVRRFVPRKICATRRGDIYEIECALKEKAEKEATKLYRLAWRMIRHGCSEESIQKCRDEARNLQGHMNLWDILNPFVRWEYAFKC